jgi:hypothetical protein
MGLRLSPSDSRAVAAARPERDWARRPGHAGTGERGEAASAGMVRVLLTYAAVQMVVVGLLASAHGFWSPDSAVRFVQVESLARSHGREIAIPYPAASLDPEGHYVPLGRWFHVARDGRQYVSYLPYFSLASVLPYRLLGFPGLAVIPAAAGLAVVWVTYRLLRRRAPGLAGAAALTGGLGTPLLVYSGVFWDHSVVAALSAGALAALYAQVDRGRPLSAWCVAGAGALLGAGLWVRSEMYVLAAAVVCAWAYASVGRDRVRGVLLLLSGLAGPAVAVWVANLRLLGSPLGSKGHELVTTRVAGAVQAASSRTSSSWILEKLGNAYYQLASPDFYAFNERAVAAGLSVALALALAALLVRAGVAARSRRMLAAGAVVALGTAVVVLSGRTVISGLLPAVPVLILGLLPGGPSRGERFLWAACGVFAGAVIVTGTHGGLQWGPRYLLPIVPPLVWLAAFGVARARSIAPEMWPALKRAAGALAVLSVVTQASGAEQVWRATEMNARLNQWVRQLPADVVVTPLEWVTTGAGQLYFEKSLMLVGSPEEFKRLVAELARQHVRRWAYIPYSGAAFRPEGVERWTAGRAWRFRARGNRAYSSLRAVVFDGSPGAP